MKLSALRGWGGSSSSISPQPACVVPAQTLLAWAGCLGSSAWRGLQQLEFTQVSCTRYGQAAQHERAYLCPASKLLAAAHNTHPDLQTLLLLSSVHSLP